jgi:hypothetical protein
VKMKPDEPLTVVERLVFGHDAERNPATGRVFQNGIGAHPRAVQARLYAAEERLGRPLTPEEGQDIVRSGALG